MIVTRCYSIPRVLIIQTGHGIQLRYRHRIENIVGCHGEYPMLCSVIDGDPRIHNGYQVAASLQIEPARTFVREFPSALVEELCQGNAGQGGDARPRSHKVDDT